VGFNGVEGTGEMMCFAKGALEEKVTNKERFVGVFLFGGCVRVRVGIV